MESRGGPRGAVMMGRWTAHPVRSQADDMWGGGDEASGPRHFTLWS